MVTDQDTRVAGVDVRGEEFLLARSGSGVVSFNPAYELRNERGERLARLKRDVPDLGDAFVVFGPDDEPLFRWKRRSKYGLLDIRRRYTLYEDGGDGPVALLERPSSWRPTTWHLSVADESVVLRRHLLPPTKLTVRDDDRVLARVQQALVRHRFRVHDEGLPPPLKAALLMGLPLLRYADNRPGH